MKHLILDFNYQSDYWKNNTLQSINTQKNYMIHPIYTASERENNPSMGSLFKIIEEKSKEIVNKYNAKMDDIFATLHRLGGGEAIQIKKLKNGITCCVHGFGGSFTYYLWRQIIINENINYEEDINLYSFYRSGENYVDKFGDENYPEWEVIAKYLQFKKYKIELVKLLSPIGFALQVFWGISFYKSDNEYVFFNCYNIQYFNQDKYYKEIKNQSEGINLKPQIFDLQVMSLLPNSNAFRLNPVSTYDFYSIPFDKIKNGGGNGGINKKVSSNNSAEEFDYDFNHFGDFPDDIASNINEVMNLKKFKDLKYTFQDNLNVENLTSDINEEFDSVFVNCLREVCAILSNTELIELSNKKTIGYKGLSGFKINKICLELNKKYDTNIFTKKHNKLHNDANYDFLAQQIICLGIKKSIIVIAGIDKLGNIF